MVNIANTSLNPYDNVCRVNLTVDLSSWEELLFS